MHAPQGALSCLFLIFCEPGKAAAAGASHACQQPRPCLAPSCHTASLVPANHEQIELRRRPVRMQADQLLAVQFREGMVGPLMCHSGSVPVRRRAVHVQVDQLLAVQFREDMVRIVEQVGRKAPGPRQTLLVSATLNDKARPHPDPP